MKIPKEHTVALKNLFNLSDESYSNITRALQECRRTIQPDELAEGLAEQVASISKSELNDLVSMLVSMYSAVEFFDLSIEEFANQVSAAAVEEKLDGLELTADAADLLEQRLSGLLETDAIAFKSKAVGVLRDQHRMFCSARILTDIRPIFDSDIESVPQSAFLIHTLRISYHEGRELDEFYVSLDQDDIINLQEVLSRSNVKDENLRNVLAKVNISALEA